MPMYQAPLDSEAMQTDSCADSQPSGLLSESSLGSDAASTEHQAVCSISLQQVGVPPASAATHLCLKALLEGFPTSMHPN